MNNAIWLALLLLPGTALADETVIYRCTSADGVPTLQRMPCPPGSQQRIQRVPDPVQPAVAAPPAAGEQAAALAAGSNAAATPRAGEQRPIMQAGMVETGDGDDAILDSALLPRHADTAAADAPAAPKPALPLLFQCQGQDGSRYLHEREPAPPRCVTLAVSGLGGGATPVNASSCEVVRDSCSQVPAEQACGNWQQHFRDARGRERFAAPDNQAAARAERERLQAVLAASDCPVPG